jgi:hypothetical protein
MLFEVAGEMNLAQSPEAEMAAVNHPTPSVATRQVWALSVARPQNDPERVARPHKVIWLGDPTLRVPGEGQTCAYCNQLDLTRCPGMAEHAIHYGIWFSSKRAEVIEVGVFDVDAELARRIEIIGQIEDMLARRLIAGVHPAAG